MGQVCRNFLQNFHEILLITFLVSTISKQQTSTFATENYREDCCMEIGGNKMLGGGFPSYKNFTNLKKWRCLPINGILISLMYVWYRAHDVISHDSWYMISMILVQWCMVHMRPMATQGLHGCPVWPMRVIHGPTVHCAVMRHSIFVLHGQRMFKWIRLTLHKARSVGGHPKTTHTNWNGGWWSTGTFNVEFVPVACFDFLFILYSWNLHRIQITLFFSFPFFNHFQQITDRNVSISSNLFFFFDEKKTQIFLKNFF